MLRDHHLLQNRCGHVWPPLDDDATCVKCGLPYGEWTDEYEITELLITIN